MRAEKRSGILGVGVFLPEEVRTNDWWPDSTVKSWVAHARGESDGRTFDFAGMSRGTRLTIEAEMALRNDPFRGTRERRVMAAGMLASEMEAKAAKDAIAKAGLVPDDIDMVLVNSSVPDYMTTNNGCALHGRLKLPQRCFAMAVEAACNSFLLQLILAEQMIAGGQVRNALLVQSSALSRICDPDFPHSVIFGDGASAVVVGAVRSECGILGRAFGTDGSRYDAIVTGVPGKNWYEEGRTVAHVRDPANAKNAGLFAAERGKVVMDDVLGQAGVDAADVGFYGGHQGTSYYRRVTQDYFGMVNARYVDTFAWAGSLSAASVPLSLYLAQEQGLLHDGDLVALFAGGIGFSWAASLLRWGR